MATLDPSPRRHRAASRLDIQISYRLGVPLVYVKGELDHDSTPTLRDAIEDELAEPPAALVLDLGDVPYMDSGGLSFMFDLLAKFTPPRWLGVVAANQGLQRLFEMTGLTDREGFRMLPDVPSAAKALASD